MGTSPPKFLNVCGTVNVVPSGPVNSDPGNFVNVISYNAAQDHKLFLAHVTFTFCSCWVLEINGAEKASGGTGPGHPTDDYFWPNGLPVSQGETVVLKLKEYSGSPVDTIRAEIQQLIP